MKRFAQGFVSIVALGAGLLAAHPARADVRAEAFSWSVTLKAAELGNDLEQAKLALDHAQDLGVTQVRTTFDWARLEPIPGEWNEQTLDFLGAYLDAADERGLEVIAVLDHAPYWAMKRYFQGDLDFFLKSYSRFTEKVATAFGDRISYYQYWSEANHGFKDPIRREDDWLVYLHGDRGVRAGDKNGHRGMINFTTDFYNQPYWLRDLKHAMERLNLTDPAHTVRIIGVNLFPETWALGGTLAWKPLEDLALELRDPASPCFGLDAAVAETGFAAYLPAAWGGLLGRSESHQESWFRRAIPELSARLHAFNADVGPGQGRFLFINIQELYDSPTAWPFNPEASLGLYWRDRQPKPAVRAIRDFLLNP